MEKTKLLRYLIDKKETIKGLDVFPRDVHLKFTKNFITSLIGPRRAGKTYFFYNLILNKFKLNDESFIFIDFEDIALTGISFKEILEAVNVHEEHYGKKPECIFLDEVQVIGNWNKSVRTLFETKKYAIFISGSSSKLLSKEIAASLRGRSLTYSIFPFSFKEFLNLKKIELKGFYSTSEKNKMKNYLRKYLEHGGFPDVIIENEIADKFFKEYIDLVIFKDVVERHNIKNVFVIKFLIKSLLSSFAKEFSIHKTFNTLKSQNIKISKKTLYNYSLYLEDAFFSFFLKKFSYSMKETELSIPKVFINDTGLVNYVLTAFSENIGNLMENSVFLELKRIKNKKPKLDFYYWRSQNKEVDFVLKEGTNVKQLIQVCYDISNLDTKKRELKALVKSSEELKCENLLIITWDYEATRKFKAKKICFMPLWKWLLQ